MGSKLQRLTSLGDLDVLALNTTRLSVRPALRVFATKITCDENAFARKIYRNLVIASDVTDD